MFFSISALFSAYRGSTQGLHELQFDTEGEAGDVVGTHTAVHYHRPDIEVAGFFTLHSEGFGAAQ